MAGAVSFPWFDALPSRLLRLVAAGALFWLAGPYARDFYAACDDMATEPPGSMKK